MEDSVKLTSSISGRATQEGKKRSINECCDRMVPGTDFSPVILNSLGGREYSSYEEIVSVDELTNKQKSVSHFQIRI